MEKKLNKPNYFNVCEDMGIFFNGHFDLFISLTTFGPLTQDY